jgi:hypothetical protein
MFFFIYSDMYEDGLEVDEIVGATDSQINNLPVSTIQVHINFQYF